MPQPLLLLKCPARPRAGSPSAPQGVAITADALAITVAWQRPATDAAASYTVVVFAEKGDATYTSAAAKTYSGIPWTGTYTGLTINGDSYTYQLPAGHGLPDGEQNAA